MPVRNALKSWTRVKSTNACEKWTLVLDGLIYLAWGLAGSRVRLRAVRCRRRCHQYFDKYSCYCSSFWISMRYGLVSSIKGYTLWKATPDTTLPSTNSKILKVPANDSTSIARWLTSCNFYRGIVLSAGVSACAYAHSCQLLACSWSWSLQTSRDAQSWGFPQHSFFIRCPFNNKRSYTR